MSPDRSVRRALACGLMCFALLSALPARAQEGEPEEGKRVGVPQGIYDKPYIARLGRGTALGGYMDHELEFTFDRDFENQGITFDQHRFIPFIYSEITDRLHLAAEIEFEHGGNPDAGGEVKIEYAATDFRLFEGLVFRGGALLSPLGYFNLVHDSPVNDLTERPLVDRQIIPSTLTESGMGFHGTFYPNELTVLNYELYVVNGFDEGIVRPGATGAPRQIRIRSGRGSLGQDNNRGKALVGRLAFSPRLGMQLGGSFHTGPYTNAGRPESDNLSIYALDALFTAGPLQLLGEYAYARIGLDGYDLDPQAQHGFYAQGNYHLPADWLLPGSVFTAVARFDYLDYALAGDLPDAVDDALTLGLNFRPVEDTVFKLDWAFRASTPAAGDRASSGSILFFSLATYF